MAPVGGQPHIVGARRMFIAMLIALLAFGLTPISAASAQSGGCDNGPFSGATTLDSDGDGASDGDEVRAGTDQCDPSDTPAAVCGELIADYDASSADTDGDGDTDSAERTGGSDPCDATSVLAGTAVTATQAPRLALTGPSSALVGALLGLAMLMIGLTSLAVGRRVDG